MLIKDLRRTGPGPQFLFEDEDEDEEDWPGAFKIEIVAKGDKGI